MSFWPLFRYSSISGWFAIQCCTSSLSPELKSCCSTIDESSVVRGRDLFTLSLHSLPRLQSWTSPNAKHTLSTKPIKGICMLLWPLLLVWCVCACVCLTTTKKAHGVSPQSAAQFFQPVINFNWFHMVLN